MGCHAVDRPEEGLIHADFMKLYPEVPKWWHWAILVESEHDRPNAGRKRAVKTTVKYIWSNTVRYIYRNGPNNKQTPTGETQGTNVTCDESYTTSTPSVLLPHGYDCDKEVAYGCVRSIICCRHGCHTPCACVNMGLVKSCH